MDIRDYNRRAWDQQVAKGDRWTIPVSAEAIERARRGDLRVVLTPTKSVPSEWLGDLRGARVLGLASAGGQQGPLLAAAGASVTVLDNSPAQLERDRAVAERQRLPLDCVQGDMADLGAFADDTFDLILHPVSSCFVPDVRPVWREAHRVLKPGAALLSGFCNPVMFIFDDASLERGELTVRHRIPYSDLTSLTEEERASYIERGEPLSFGHTLEDQLGGQIDAGFLIAGFYEDRWPEDEGHPLDGFIDSFIATRAIKPG